MLRHVRSGQVKCSDKCECAFPSQNEFNQSSCPSMSVYNHTYSKIERRRGEGRGGEGRRSRLGKVSYS